MRWDVDHGDLSLGSWAGGSDRVVVIGFGRPGQAIVHSGTRAISSLIPPLVLKPNPDLMLPKLTDYGPHTLCTVQMSRLAVARFELPNANCMTPVRNRPAKIQMWSRNLLVGLRGETTSARRSQLLLGRGRDLPPTEVTVMKDFLASAFCNGIRRRSPQSGIGGDTSPF